MRIDQALQQAAQQLADSDSARLDAEVLLSRVLNKDRTYLYTWPERELTCAEQQAFAQLVARRCQGEPVAYLTGEQEFWSLPLKTHRKTLIPRPETELLVEQALALGAGLAGAGARPGHGNRGHRPGACLRAARLAD